MPSNLAPAVPDGVLPYGLCLSFQEELRHEALINQLQNGYCVLNPLTLNPRRFFRLTRPLTAAQLVTLRDFYISHIAKPFYFYDLRSTVPPWSYDPTGQSPDGRYVVVFDSAWVEDLRPGRNTTGFALREVA